MFCQDLVQFRAPVAGEQLLKMWKAMEPGENIIGHWVAATWVKKRLEGQVPVRRSNWDRRVEQESG